MAVSVSEIRLVAHLPFILGLLRTLEVAAVLDQACTTRSAGSLMKAPRGGQRRGERA